MSSLDPPHMSRSYGRRLRWAISRQRKTNPAVDRWIADLARREDPLPARQAVLDELGQILADGGDLEHEGGLPDETGFGGSVSVPASLLSAVYQELERLLPPGAAPLRPGSVEHQDSALEALASALSGNALDSDWARSEAARVLGELARSGWQLARPLERGELGPGEASG
jgi:hypothetical protein